MVQENTVVIVNRVAIWVHFVLALIVLINVIVSGNDLVFETVMGELAPIGENSTMDPLLPNVTIGDTVFQTRIRGTGMKLSVTAMVFSFSMLSALGQLFWACNTEAYKKFMVGNGINWFRYIEYSVSASIMLVLITTQLGILDWGTLVGIAGCTWSCMIFGLLGDILYHAQFETFDGILGFLMEHKRIAWVAHMAGWVALACPFWVILATFNGMEFPPGFVTAIIGTETPLFVIFGFVQIAQFYNGSNGNITKEIELTYIILSLTSKTLLSIFVYILVLV